MSTAKKATEVVAFNELPAINTNAAFYRERVMQEKRVAAFYNEDNHPDYDLADKTEFEVVVKAASHVRHNPLPMKSTFNRIHMIDGIPCKIKNGKYVPLTAVVK